MRGCTEVQEFLMARRIRVPGFDLSAWPRTLYELSKKNLTDLGVDAATASGLMEQIEEAVKNMCRYGVIVGVMEGSKEAEHLSDDAAGCSADFARAVNAHVIANKLDRIRAALSDDALEAVEMHVLSDDALKDVEKHVLGDFRSRQQRAETVMRVFDRSPQVEPVVKREEFQAEEDYHLFSRGGYDLMGKWEFDPLGANVLAVFFYRLRQESWSIKPHCVVVAVPKALAENSSAPNSATVADAELHKLKRFIRHYVADNPSLPRLPWLHEGTVKRGLDAVACKLQNKELVQAMDPIFMKLTNASIDPPRGLLLWGPPGTGKSTTACLMAEHVGFAQVREKGLAAGEMLDGLVGGTEKNIKTILRRAHACPWLPCCVVIDEIETLAPNRASKKAQASGGASSSALGIILTYFQGVNDVPNLFIFGATNLKNDIDDAFSRRMHGKVFVGLPSALTRRNWDLRDTTIALSDVCSEWLSLLTVNFSGAAMKLVVEEMQLKAKRNDQGTAIFTEPECLAAIVGSVCQRERIVLGGVSVPKVLRSVGCAGPESLQVKRSDHHCGSLQSRLWQWFMQDFGCLVDVLQWHLLPSMVTGRICINLGALNQRNEDAANHGGGEVPWKLEAPTLEIQMTDGTLHTMRPQLCGEAVRSQYLVTPDHFKALLVHLAVQLDVSCLRVVDSGYFMSESCDTQEDMIHCLREAVSQCGEYQRSIILLDLDSCNIDVNPDAEMPHEAIHRVDLFETMLHVAKSASFAESASEFRLVCCLTKFDCVFSRFAKHLLWPLGVGKRLKKAKEEFNASFQRCGNEKCRTMFRPIDNEEKHECRPHKRDSLESTKTPKDTSDLACEISVVMEKTVDSKAHYVWTCCGQPWSSTACTDPEVARPHTQSKFFDVNAKLGCGAATRRHWCYHKKGNTNFFVPLPDTAVERCWCNVCSAPIDGRKAPASIDRNNAARPSEVAEDGCATCTSKGCAQPMVLARYLKSNPEEVLHCASCQHRDSVKDRCTKAQFFATRWSSRKLLWFKRRDKKSNTLVPDARHRLWLEHVARTESEAAVLRLPFGGGQHWLRLKPHEPDNSAHKGLVKGYVACACPPSNTICCCCTGSETTSIFFHRILDDDLLGERQSTSRVIPECCKTVNECKILDMDHYMTTRHTITAAVVGRD